MIELRAATNLWMAQCEKPNCFYARSFKNQPAAILEFDAHDCPTPQNGMTHYAWEITMTLVEQLWAMMDADYATLLTSNQNDPWQSTDEITSIALLKGNLRGLARATAVFMTPHFNSPDEVVAEVVKRADMAIAGETYSTPGLGSRIYEPPPGDKGKYALVAQTVKADNKLIDPEVEAKVMRAYKSGQFTLPELAEMFSLRIEEVNSVITAH